jgi:hypothetical protein
MNLTAMYFKTIEDIKNLEMDKSMFENTYLWGKGRELKHKKIKLKLIENKLKKC